MNGTSPGSTAVIGRQEGSPPEYRLSDDLARMCLPAEYKDANRTLAWVNSICFLFIVIGLVGIKPPKIVERPLSEIAEPVAVELPTPQEQPPVQVDTPPEEVPQDIPTDVPQVAAAVLATDAQVAFPVPVPGAVAVPEARFATPPPSVNFTPPTLTRFNPDAMRGGSFPEIQYPPSAWRAKIQGTATMVFTVDANGVVTSAKLQKTSGSPILDNAVFNALTNRWKFPAGSPGYFIKDFEFHLNL